MDLQFLEIAEMAKIKRGRKELENLQTSFQKWPK